jgi:zinc finger protein
VRLTVASRADFDRLVLKSDNTSFFIPEVDFELVSSNFGAAFTTLEGLLTSLTAYLRTTNPFSFGDSMAEDSHAAKFASFMADLEGYVRLEKGPFTVVLEDLLGNCYIENPKAPEEDANLTVEEFERTFEQNEELGLNDMRTEGYIVDDERAEHDELPPSILNASLE